MEKSRFVDLGVQSFEKLRERNAFYVDKTGFIREWWEHGSDVTLITRPRRFGKTLNLDMLNCFFSNRYAGRGELFEGLSVWEEEKYRQLQGTYPVVFLSFASVKTGEIKGIKAAVKWMITDVYRDFADIMESERFGREDREDFAMVKREMDDITAVHAINRLCKILEKYFDKKVIVFLDEYDTPMQEAWLGGDWEEAVRFFRLFFNATFKTNFSLYRAAITGITRISKESIFSDLNNWKAVTITSNEYAEYFGFTEAEVFEALDAMGLEQCRQGVKEWYDGFNIGLHTDIYNPWSIASFLQSGGKYDIYWANTSSNGLVSTLLQTGSAGMKQNVEDLLDGKSFQAQIDEQIVYSQIEEDENAIWSLLLASGYLKVLKTEPFCAERTGDPRYTLTLTNREVLVMFRRMVRGWFGIGTRGSACNDFVKALLQDDVDYMNEFMNKIALLSFSSFDVAKNASAQDDPERFYHGFVLGLMVGLEGRFVITSNRESGFGRYDIMLEPVNKEKDNAYIIEFKVRRPSKEKDLTETVANALAQIREKKYEAQLIAAGIAPEQIRKYGFAFEGKRCLIG